MSPYTICLAPRTSLSWRIQIGHKSGLLFMSSVNIKPTRHRFGFSLAWDWQYMDGQTDKQTHQGGGGVQEEASRPVEGG